MSIIDTLEFQSEADRQLHLLVDLAPAAEAAESGPEESIFDQNDQVRVGCMRQLAVSVRRLRSTKPLTSHLSPLTVGTQSSMEVRAAAFKPLFSTACYEDYNKNQKDAVASILQQLSAR